MSRRTAEPRPGRTPPAVAQEVVARGTLYSAPRSFGVMVLSSPGKRRRAGGSSRAACGNSEGSTRSGSPPTVVGAAVGMVLAARSGVVSRSGPASLPRKTTARTAGRLPGGPWPGPRRLGHLVELADVLAPELDPAGAEVHGLPVQQPVLITARDPPREPGFGVLGGHGGRVRSCLRTLRKGAHLAHPRVGVVPERSRCNYARKLHLGQQTTQSFSFNLEEHPTQHVLT
jgi:hypothetical protein